MAGKERISRKKFIGLGAALGLGSVGPSVIAGCGGGGGSAGSGGTTTTSTGMAESTAGSSPEVGKGQAIAMESEGAPDTAFPFTDADTGRPGVLLRLESGELAAYSAVCTHQACTFAYRPVPRFGLRSGERRSRRERPGELPPAGGRDRGQRG